MRRLKAEAAHKRELLERDELTPFEDAALERALVAKLHGKAEPTRRAVWAWRLALGSAAAAAAVIALVVLPRSSGNLQGWRVLSGEDCVAALPEGVHITAQCDAVPRLDLQGAQTTLSPGTRLLRAARGVRLAYGRATFAVVHVPAAAAGYEVRVSHGTIVVTGTRFTIDQREADGTVEVEQGAIQFRWDDNGSVETVPAGQRLIWPRAAAAAPATSTLQATTTSTTQAPTGPAAGAPMARPRDGQVDKEPGQRSGWSQPRSISDPEAIMQRLFRLRTQGLYDQAEELLRSASRDKGFSATQRERFSFELGNILQQQRGRAAACAHWRMHARAYPRSPHAAFIEEALRSCE